MPSSNGSTFAGLVERLDEIVLTVKAKDTTLEESLDLFDEDIRLGTDAVEKVDSSESVDREMQAALPVSRTSEGPAVSDAR